jgi:hypothetical protein
VEARAKQRLRPTDALQGSHDVQRERNEPVVIRVRQLAFRLRPEELIGIELRRVAGKAVRLHSGMAVEKGLDVPTPMNFPAVPQEHDRASHVAEQLAEKRNDFGARDVAHVEIKVQPEPTALWSHGERRDDGHPVPSVAMPNVRGVPDGRPRLADIGNEQEAAFIEEGEMGVPARGVFLTAAIRPASTWRWPPRRARSSSLVQ